MINIDVIRLQSLKALLNGTHDVVSGETASVGIILVHRTPDLRSKDQLRPQLWTIAQPVTLETKVDITFENKVYMIIVRNYPSRSPSFLCTG